MLPSACERYSVTELEFGLMINIHAIKYLLRGVEFDAFVDHIWTSKDEPCTDRMRKMLFKLSDYVFNVKYMKGSNLVLADCLSRAPRSNDTEFDVVQPVSFSVSVQTDEENAHDKELVMPIQPYTRPVTRAYAKEHGLEVPDIYPQKVSRDNLDISTDSLDISDDLLKQLKFQKQLRNRTILLLIYTRNWLLVS